MKYKGGHRTTVMSKSASVYCSNVKRHMAAIRARKSPAMGGEAPTLVAAVEPTVRAGLIAREVGSQPAAARKAVATAMAPETAAPTANAAAAVLTVRPPARRFPVARVPARCRERAARRAAESVGGLDRGRVDGGRARRAPRAARRRPVRRCVRLQRAGQRGTAGGLGLTEPVTRFQRKRPGAQRFGPFSLGERSALRVRRAGDR